MMGVNSLSKILKGDIVGYAEDLAEAPRSSGELRYLYRIKDGLRVGLTGDLPEMLYSEYKRFFSGREDVIWVYNDSGILYPYPPREKSRSRERRNLLLILLNIGSTGRELYWVWPSYPNVVSRENIVEKIEVNDIFNDIYRSFNEKWKTFNGIIAIISKIWGFGWYISDYKIDKEYCEVWFRRGDEVVTFSYSPDAGVIIERNGSIVEKLSELDVVGRFKKSKELFEKLYGQTQNYSL